MQQKKVSLEQNNVQLVVVAEQDATARQALTALGGATDVPILLGALSVYSDYRVAGVPANYLIDPKGQLVTQASGWLPTLPDRWLKLISDLGTK